MIKEYLAKYIMEEYQKKLLHTMIRPCDEDELIVDINPQSKELIHDTFLIASKQYFDFPWFEASLKYTKDLNYYDKFTLKSYTSNGDMLINTYLRSNEIISTDYVVFAVQLFKLYDSLSESYFTQYNELSDIGIQKANELIAQYQLNILEPNVNLTRLKMVIDTYINDLRNIIINAPLCNRDIIAFRGVKDDYLMESDKYINLKGFQSLTYSIDSAITFRKDALYEIVIQKNTPCVAMEYISRHSKEKEILICDNTIFKPSKKITKYILDSMQLYSEDSEYTEWNYILNKLLDPSNDITKNINANNNSNNNSQLLTPKQIEQCRRVYCAKSGQSGGRLHNNVTIKNRNNNLNRTAKRSMNKVMKSNIHISNIEDKKSRFTEPMIINKIFTKLPLKDEENFNKFILENGGRKYF